MQNPPPESLFLVSHFKRESFFVFGSPRWIVPRKYYILYRCTTFKTNSINLIVAVNKNLLSVGTYTKSMVSHKYNIQFNLDVLFNISCFLSYLKWRRLVPCSCCSHIALFVISIIKFKYKIYRYRSTKI